VLPDCQDAGQPLRRPRRQTLSLELSGRTRRLSQAAKLIEGHLSPVHPPEPFLFTDLDPESSRTALSPPARVPVPALTSGPALGSRLGMTADHPVFTDMSLLRQARTLRLPWRTVLRVAGKTSTLVGLGRRGAINGRHRATPSPAGSSGYWLELCRALATASACRFGSP
jgi:hypothetical protein